jgi:predicted transcriptional regulator of viral defense system
VVARRQLVKLGVSEHSVDRRIAIGRLHRVHAGVYAVGHPLLSRHAAWMAAVLACGPDAVLSHGSAAALWGIRDTRGGAVHVTLPRKLRRPTIDTHRIVLPADEVTSERGIPATTVTRTLLDLAAVLTEQQLAHAVNQAEVLRLASPLPLGALAARYPRRRGTVAVRRVLERQRAIGETVTRSRFERRFLDFAERHALPRPHQLRILLATDTVPRP